jgi:hypothetical protein
MHIEDDFDRLILSPVCRVYSLIIGGGVTTLALPGWPRVSFKRSFWSTRTWQVQSGNGYQIAVAHGVISEAA